MAEFNFKQKIEDMTPEETRERIRAGYEHPTPKLVLMPFLGTEEQVTYQSDDVVARCPATGIADVYTLRLTFTPDKHIPELKSLKLYLNEYQQLPISHEHMASKIHNEFLSQVKPNKLETELIAAIRGGIKTTVNLRHGQ